MIDLRTHVALITGGGKGLGAAAALALAEAGADIALLGRQSAPLDDVARQVQAHGRQIAVAQADVADREATRTAIDRLTAQVGPMTILVNNAAISDPVGRIAEMDPAAWEYNLAVNLNGPFFCTRAVLPGMLARGWGRIINISSGAATGANPGLAAYSAAKAALNHFTRILAAEVAGTGVMPIVLAPGIMDTPMQTAVRAQPAPEAEMFRQYHAQGWLRPPAEAAACVAWLCGPAGAAYAGEVVNIHSTAIRHEVGLPDLPEALRRP